MAQPPRAAKFSAAAPQASHSNSYNNDYCSHTRFKRSQEHFEFLAALFPSSLSKFSTKVSKVIRIRIYFDMILLLDRFCDADRCRDRVRTDQCLNVELPSQTLNVPYKM